MKSPFKTLFDHELELTNGENQLDPACMRLIFMHGTQSIVAYNEGDDYETWNFIDDGKVIATLEPSEVFDNLLK